MLRLGDLPSRRAPNLQDVGDRVVTRDVGAILPPRGAVDGTHALHFLVGLRVPRAAQRGWRTHPVAYAVLDHERTHHAAEVGHHGGREIRRRRLQGQPERATHCAPALPIRDVGVVRPVQGGGVVGFVTRQISAGREQLQVASTQGRSAIGCGECFEGFQPSPRASALATSLQIVLGHIVSRIGRPSRASSDLGQGVQTFQSGFGGGICSASLALRGACVRASRSSRPGVRRG